jgi:hypothetical protein
MSDNTQETSSRLGRITRAAASLQLDGNITNVANSKNILDALLINAASTDFDHRDIDREISASLADACLAARSQK